jgi:hypothetical protein
MSSASQSILPFVILNLGGEMIYILDQRLRSQEIGIDRAKKVLSDIVKSMLSESFQVELFRPQPMYSMTSIKQIFQKLAHSSIMKLNATSMSKLFDLMLMGQKYQMLHMNQAEDLFHITMKHLTTVFELIKQSSAEKNVQETI